ncbi:MAG: hypothetical protein C0453_09440, partial [Comamonadaceae bacterium]|nr:hypothetical protein [Comamonadaceae bacterium]
ALGIEEQRVNVIVEAIAPDAAATQGIALGEGYRVDARITVSSHDDALLVPTAALVRDASQWRVLVVENGRTLARSVTVLDRNADMGRVDGGAPDTVKEGDQVVLYPGTTIQAGQRVKTRE